jgi:2,4-dienoyl-CoA reductase-like NADH-dependent reductase (Old Yellow Enzyme family)
VLKLYSDLARGGVGLIITGDFQAIPGGWLDKPEPLSIGDSYERVRVKGLSGLVKAVKTAAPDCKVISQISAHVRGFAPSAVQSPLTGRMSVRLSKKHIKIVVRCVINTIVGLKNEGFDGVQIHAAHGGMMSRFLSPYSNRREDEHGGSYENNARIIKEIVSGARIHVRDFPILIKMNCTDYIDGGIDEHSFPLLAKEIENCGVDAIEISGGMWDCLVRSEAELGFRPVPAPESHTGIHSPEKQSYFLKYVEALDLKAPLILSGGNRDIERVEGMVREKKVDFVSMCRPLISEPELPIRWREGLGSSGTDCISCNSCIYDLRFHPRTGPPWVSHCLVKHEPSRVKIAQQWLSDFEREIRLKRKSSSM